MFPFDDVIMYPVANHYIEQLFQLLFIVEFDPILNKDYLSEHPNKSIKKHIL